MAVFTADLSELKRREKKRLRKTEKGFAVEEQAASSIAHESNQRWKARDQHAYLIDSGGSPSGCAEVGSRGAARNRNWQEWPNITTQTLRFNRQSQPTPTIHQPKLHLGKGQNS